MDRTNTPAEPPDGGALDERIGPYRLLHVLGEGGMGVVYLAEQTEPVRREVALKVLKPGMDTRQVVARFEAERQALAVMEHPNIARVFDAGATAAGRPYFVMERVSGVPLTQYCDERRLDLRARLRLMAQVCRAVQHAHQKGVIHRDLKPSNVLVSETDGEPQPKIIDFGIAKATERPQDETQLTQLDQSLGTPAYMSPEQVDTAGGDIDTRADIYSLGVLLYELLTGVLPFEPQAYRGWAFYAQHLVREPLPPSARFAALTAEVQVRSAELRRTDPGAMRRQLRGELDWIITRALEKDRERRYDAANGLALDIERFLANEPVLAGPPSHAYRARKFVRRHRVGVGFAAVLAVVLIGFAASMTVQAERVARARDLATARQAQAEDLIGFMVGDLRGKLTPLGRLDILDDVGERALAYFAAVPEAELSDDELFRRAEAIRQLGEVRLDQGNLEAASAAFDDALALMRQLTARDPRRTDWQLALGGAHFWVGEVLRRQGDLEGARRSYTDYVDVAAALVWQDSTNLAWRRELAMASGNLGGVAYMQRDFATALHAWQQRLQTRRLLLAQDTANLDLQFDLSNAHNQLGLALQDDGALGAALEHFRADVSLKRGLIAQDPRHQAYRGFLAVSLNYLARLERALGLADSAVVHHHEELELNTQLARHDPENAVWQRRLALSHVRLGELYLAAGDAERAAPLAARATALIEDLVAKHPTQRSWRVELGFRQRDQAELALARGEPRRALRHATVALATIDSVLAVASDDRNAREAAGVAHLARGRAWGAIGAADSAGVAAARAVELLEPLARESRHWPLLDSFARALVLSGRSAEGERVTERLLNMGYREPAFAAFVTHYRGQTDRSSR
jgi:eukaryotic-like serine/threonine-protein kinase